MDLDGEPVLLEVAGPEARLDAAAQGELPAVLRLRVSSTPLAPEAERAGYPRLLSARLRMEAGWWSRRPVTCEAARGDPQGVSRAAASLAGFSALAERQLLLSADEVLLCPVLLAAGGEFELLRLNDPGRAAEADQEWRARAHQPSAAEVALRWE